MARKVMTNEDMMRKKVKFNFPPKRIISLVPSQSELLWELGLQKEMAGITKFCIHPEKMFRTVTRAGGTKKLDLKKIEALIPDLIIGNKEENEKSDIEALRKKFPVWMSDIHTIEQALEMILKIGEITGKKKQAFNLIKQTEKELSLSARENFSPINTAYFIWQNPWMAAGRNNFINDMLSLAGFKNAFASAKFHKKDFSNNNLRYPIITKEQLRKANPELILLSSEPYPFKKKHLEELKYDFPMAKVMLIDGEMTSWYGSRLPEGIKYLREFRKKI